MHEIDIPARGLEVFGVDGDHCVITFPFSVLGKQGVPILHRRRYAFLREQIEFRRALVIRLQPAAAQDVGHIHGRGHSLLSHRVVVQRFQAVRNFRPQRHVINIVRKYERVVRHDADYFELAHVIIDSQLSAVILAVFVKLLYLTRYKPIFQGELFAQRKLILQIGWNYDRYDGVLIRRVVLRQGFPASFFQRDGSGVCKSCVDMHRIIILAVPAQ